MVSTPTEAELKAGAQRNAGVRRFFYRQFCLTPVLPRDVSFKGKTAIVTGANHGIGLETSRQLLDRGLSKLILAVRDESKGKTARTNLLRGRNLAEDAIEVWNLDMLSYESITAFVERVKTLERLDIAILNAGIMKQTYALASSTNHEESVQVNYLSTALLAILLLPILKAKAKANVSTSEATNDAPNDTTNNTPEGHLVWVQSEVASWAKFKEKDSTPLLAALDKPENFNVLDRYGTSKLLGQLFVTKLAKQVPSSVAIITMPTPGWCRGTNLGVLPGFNIAQTIVNCIKRIIGRKPEVGARVVTEAASHGVEAHGQYLQEGKVQPKAAFVYEDDGGRVTQLLWEETMAELSFARAEDIVRELSK